MHQYLDCEFYSIVRNRITREKQIHIWGYVYSCDEDTIRPYRDLEYTGLFIPLKDFISDNFDYNRIQSETKQYIGDLTEKDAYNLMDMYFHNITSDEKKSPVELPFKDLNMNTKCGDYVNYRKE